MISRRLLGRALAVLSCAAGSASVRAGEPEILSNLEAYFATDDADRRDELVAAIEADPAYDPARLSEWLHSARLHPSVKPGEQKINVPLEDGAFRTVLVRTPPDYTPDRRWPMILMFHGSFAGVGEDWSLRVLKRILGERIDEFIIACPGNFEQDVIDTAFEPSVEHPAVLLALKRMLEIDSDRVYVLGISMGGYCCWTLATLHADQFAGAIPMSATYSVPAYIDGLWETMITNARHLPIVSVWGADDANTTIQVHGVPADPTIPALNHRFMQMARDLGLDNIRFHEIPGRGHFPAFPPNDLRDDILSARRVEAPPDVLHRFRYIYQSSAYWLEGHTWTGDQWRMNALLFVTLRAAPDERRVETGRWIHDCLGELRGEHDGQRFDIHRKHVGEMTMWIGSGMVDWEKAVHVIVDGQVAFEGVLAPHLGVALAQAARTWDFDRLRWAGLRIDEAGRATPVTARTFFPALFDVEAYAVHGGK